MRLGTLLLVVSMTFAGCVGEELDPENVDDALNDPASILPWLGDGDDHDHTHYGSHAASWNVDVVGHSWLGVDPANVGLPERLLDDGWWNQLVAGDGYAYVASYEVPGTGSPGLVVVDLADPANPEVVGTYTSTDDMGSRPIDIWLTSDGRYALLASQRWYPTGERLDWPVPCPGLPTGTQACLPREVADGVQVVDVTDPANPTLAAYYRLAPSGAHTVKTANIDGTEYMFASDYGLYSMSRSASTVDIARLVEGSAGVGVEHVANYRIDLQVDGEGFVHDMWIEQHPLDGRWLLYVAAWDAGMHIVDVTDPANPQRVAVWNDFDPGRYGNIHSMYTSPDLVDGVHVTVVAPEYGSSDHGGMLWFLDTTDPANPATISTFQLPNEPVLNPGGYLYSPHNGFIQDGVFHHGHNHAGYWAIQFGTPETLREPRAIAYHFPTPPAQEWENAPGERGAATLWNAWFMDGHALLIDRYTGLHVVRLGTMEPGTPPWAGLGDA